jgi:hypothetical protein
MKGDIMSSTAGAIVRHASIAATTSVLCLSSLSVRHDCFVPEDSYQDRPSAEVTTDPDTLVAVDELLGRLGAAWGPGTSLETLEAVYAPDAVDTARYLDGTLSHVGPEGILQVARLGGSPSQIGEPVVFSVPGMAAGELAWATAADVADGTICLFHARDGLMDRHDCVLPVAIGR